MFARLVNQTVQLQPKPSFILIGGDMQNFWPNEDGDGRNANANVPNLTMDGKDMGFRQRQDVKDKLAVATERGILVHYTPGNHDVGDEPNTNAVNTMSLYTENWGPQHEVVLQEDSVLYLQFNSQLYWFSDPSLSAAKQQQNAWLDTQLKRVSAADTKLIVLMTHIPPFMNDAAEDEGWANWKKSDREEVLTMMANRKIPMLWLCGHFHGNVRKDGSYKGVPLHIRVSSAAGTTMQWGGRDSFTPEQAATIATKSTAGIAFDEDIVDGNFANIAERLQATDTRSGLRVIRTYTDGSFQDGWFTVKDLETAGTHSVEELFERQAAAGKALPAYLF